MPKKGATTMNTSPASGNALALRTAEEEAGRGNRC
jgi:hypothetical protein